MNTSFDTMPSNIRTQYAVTAEEGFATALQEAASDFVFYRKAGWEAFQKLNWPTRKDPNWRFGEPKKIVPEGFMPSPALTSPMADLINESSRVIERIAGRLVFADGHLVASDPIGPDLAAKGVRFLSLEEAFAICPEQIQPYYLTNNPTLGSAKYHALHQAYAGTGTFLYVPRGVEICEPFLVYHWALAPHVALFPHTLIIAEENSAVNLVDIYESFDEDSAAFACGMAHVYAKTGARVFRKSVQLWNTVSQSIQIEAAWAEKDANVNSVSVQLGGQYSRFENQAFMEGAGSHVQLAALSVTNGEQIIDSRSLQVHTAPNATSDLLYKNALLGESKTIFAGMIVVEPNAQKTDAYQTNRNLLLSKEAEAIALPGLEIEANDVKCSHGATTAPIDETAAFYLQSRGISRSTAEELLVFGFFEEVIERVAYPELAEHLRTVVSKQFQKPTL